jgi:hypothetical protein
MDDETFERWLATISRRKDGSAFVPCSDLMGRELSQEQTCRFGLALLALSGPPAGLLTAEDLAAIRGRAEAATPGPWRSHEDDAWCVRSDAEGLPDSGWIAEMGPARKGNEENDGQFIAHARTDIPRLLDALARAEGEVEYGRMLVRELRDPANPEALVAQEYARGVEDGVKQSGVEAVIAGQCRYNGCTAAATTTACGRDEYPREPTPYCEPHARIVGDDGAPEYTEACPNCGCRYGVN